MIRPLDARGPWRHWTAAGLLKASLAAQCVLALLVVVGDMPADFLRNLTGDPSGRPTTEVPVTPGDQTRRFDPRRLPGDRPAGPGFPGDEAVPSRLLFTTASTEGEQTLLLLTGAIEAGDARRFSDHLAALSARPDAIALHSPGGDVAEALLIGRAIRAASLPVVVASGAACFSACPYVLAGGTAREVSQQARIGVHQHYFGGNTFLPAFLAVSDVQTGQGEVMTYLGEMGIDPMMMAPAMATPPDDIYIFLPDELERYRLATKLTE